MRRFTIYIKNQITIILIMKYLVAWQKSLHYAVYEEVHYLHKDSVAWQKTLHYAGYEEVHYLHKESNHYYFNYEILGGMAAKDFALCWI